MEFGLRNIISASSIFPNDGAPERGISRGTASLDRRYYCCSALQTVMFWIKNISSRLVAKQPDCRPFVCLPSLSTDTQTESLKDYQQQICFRNQRIQYEGRGAGAWRYDRGEDCFVNAATDQKFSSDALSDYLRDLSRSGRVILQNRLRNHAALSPLTNGALSTLRIVTCTTPSGSIDLLPPVICMPAGRLVVDNFSQGGLAAPIDFATGTICGPAVQKDNHLGLISTNRHPDTGQEFNGFLIPMWSEAVELARRAHQETFPSMQFIGWDIAILQDGPVFVEGNFPFDTDLTVLPHGLTLSDTQFIPCYNYHWARSVLANAASA